MKDKFKVQLAATAQGLDCGWVGGCGGAAQLSL